MLMPFFVQLRSALLLNVKVGGRGKVNRYTLYTGSDSQTRYVLYL